jgi:hypothetical protein
MMIPATITPIISMASPLLVSWPGPPRGQLLSQPVTYPRLYQPNSVK